MNTYILETSIEQWHIWTSEQIVTVLLRAWVQTTHKNISRVEEETCFHALLSSHVLLYPPFLLT